MRATCPDHGIALPPASATSASPPEMADGARHDSARNAFGVLIDAVGHASFDARLITYFQQVLPIDRVITLLLDEQAPPTLLGVAPEADPASLGRIFARLERSGRSSAERGRRLGRARTDARVEDLRMTTPLGAGRTFVALLGRSARLGPWRLPDIESAERSVAMIHPVVAAHDRARPIMAGQHALAGDWRRQQIERCFERHGLTPRERQIASMVLRGFSSLAIALDAGISEATVKVHRKHINRKLGISSQAELFGFALAALGTTEDASYPLGGMAPPSERNSMSA